ncbi:MAG: Uma2 family endonuclease [Gemmataceae bacterium]|nr:Uma2 family endonuclease [Gemmataceae bacterium]
MIVPNRTVPKNSYPTSDGKPMAETELHGLLMFALIQTLRQWYSQEELVYVWGNLLMYYEQGNRRRHVSPDVFVVKGVPKTIRDNYLIWEEGRAPDLVIELTSSSTRRNDVGHKFLLYQNVMRVPEYFLFDPHGDYLDPILQGYRLHGGEYVRIEPVDGRLPSEVLGLHLERRGEQLRLFNPATGLCLRTPEEEAAETQARAAQAERAAEQARARADQAETRAVQTAAENERLRREIEELRRGTTPKQ